MNGAPCNLDDPDVLPFAELSEGFFVLRGTAQGAEIPHDVPQPARTFSERLNLDGPPGHGNSALYIITRNESGAPDDFDWAATRAHDLGWPVRELLGSHVVYRTKPREVVDLILD
jgi:hypothetical protein